MAANHSNSFEIKYYKNLNIYLLGTILFISSFIQNTKDIFGGHFGFKMATKNVKFLNYHHFYVFLAVYRLDFPLY